MKEELTKEIDNFKSVLDTLPVNTIKARSKKKSLIEEEIQNKTNTLNSIQKEIDSRKSTILSFPVNPELKTLNDSITNCATINNFTDYNTPYEKIKLDAYLYQLHRYYKENICNVNECINSIIMAFKQVKINLTSSDFNYNYYVQKYIHEIFKHSTKEILNKTFEECYWKCPEMLTILELNFKSIYLRDEKKINNFYSEAKEEFIKKSNIDTAINLYISLNDKLEDISLNDEHTILSKFVDNTNNIYDYNEMSIDKLKKHYFNDNYSLAKAKSLRISLIEYKIIEDYEVIIKDMKERLSKKDTFKGQRNTLIKEINTLEKKLISLNKKMYYPNKIKWFNKKSNNDEKSLFAYQETYEKLLEKFNDFEDKNFNETIYQDLSSNSSILDALRCVSFNFIYFANMIKQNEENITFDELTERFNKLKDIIFKYNYKILESNILLDDKDIAQIICDKYKLENINITKEELEKDAILKCIDDIEKLIIDDHIKQSKLSISDIQFIIELNKNQNK